MSIRFKYVPSAPEPLSGRGFIEQTEAAFNDLGDQYDGLEAEVIDKANQALAAAQSAENAADSALSIAQNAETAAQEAKNTAGNALTVGQGAANIASQAQIRADEAYDKAATSLSQAEMAISKATDAVATADHAEDVASEVSTALENLRVETEILPPGSSGSGYYDAATNTIHIGIPVIGGQAETFIGDIRLLSVPPDLLADMAPGWYFCGGDTIELDVFSGRALKALPEGFKTRWGIVENGTSITLPKLFHDDGRGYFFRAVNSAVREVGSVELDGIKAHNHPYQSPKMSNNMTAGAAAVANGTNNSTTSSTGGPENLVLNIGLIPAIYLGV